MVVKRGDSDWARRYARGLTITDFLVVTWAVIGAQLLRFGVSAADEVQVSARLSLTFSYTIITVVLILAWLLMLAVFKTRDARIVGVGATEYRLIVQATLWLFGLAAIVLFLTKTDIARAYILIALPLGLLFLLISRWLWRQWLNSRRQSGAFSYRVLLVGSLESVTPLARDLDRAVASGYQLVGAVIPGMTTSAGVLHGTSIPLRTGVDAILPTMAELGADTLVITSSDYLPPSAVRELSWGLDPGHQHLVMAPNLTDVGGPRIHMRPVAGLPLMHVETPRFVGPQLFLKRTFDLIASAVLIVLASPILLVTTIVIRGTSRGPALFTQDRAGYGGRAFKVYKFRSMIVGAESKQADLEAQNESGGAIFKIREDPRITPVGRFIRRWSIDELPQLFNVFLGSMSLVGPRPHPLRDVERYEAHVNRRFLVKPGITGLWQVSGRSNLSWEDAVRLDLYYVENWSVMGDLLILWRTFKAVFAKEGAY